MRVLIAHTMYSASQPSGENLTVADIASGLADIGVDVQLCDFEADLIPDLSFSSKFRLAQRPLWTRHTEQWSRLIETFRPDVVQLHNAYPFVPLAELFGRAARGLPVNHVVHNFRHSCIAGNHFRDGVACFDCGPGRWQGLPGVAHRCYRGSTPQSAIMAASNAVHFKAWRQLDYTCISTYMKSYLTGIGFNPDRTAVIHNPVGSINDGQAVLARNRDVVFAGRLEPEKGVEMLLEAWTGLPQSVRDQSTLHIAGSGSLQATVSAAAGPESSIHYHGLLSPAELGVLAARCRITVVPSVWDEPFGRVVIEAYRGGRTVIVTPRGGLPELVISGATGWIAPAEPAAWTQALRNAIEQTDQRMMCRAQDHWRSNFSREVVARRYSEHFTRIVKR